MHNLKKACNLSTATHNDPAMKNLRCPDRQRLAIFIVQAKPDYEVYLRKKRYSKSTIRQYLAILSHLAKEFESKNMLLRNIVQYERALPKLNTSVPVYDKPRTAHLRRGLVAFIGFLIETKRIKPTARKFPYMHIVLPFQAYLKRHKALSDKSIRLYSYQIKEFLSWRFPRHAHSKVRGLSHLQADDLYRYVAYKRSTTFQNYSGQAVKHLYAYARHRNLLAGHVTIALPRVQSNIRKPLAVQLTPQQIEQFLSAQPLTTPIMRRNVCALRLLQTLAIRRKELRAIRLGDIDWGAATIAIRGKNSRIERMPVPKQVVLRLADYVRHDRPNHAPNDHLFIGHTAPFRVCDFRSLDRMAILTPDLAKLPKNVGTRFFRHAVATELVNAEVPFEDVSKVLRHTTLQATHGYARSSNASLLRAAAEWPMK